MIASIPMNVCANPEPGIETNGELKPVAIAFASIVLPVPGAPTKSRPRSRLPPARSNASPDCQSVTTRRTSSFASTWPRTSASLTPHCASPGSKPRICEMPMISIGPMKIAKLAMKRKKTKTTCTQSAGVADAPRRSFSKMKANGAPPRALAAEEPDDRVDRDRGRSRAGSFLRQYQARRRPITSSSRSCWLSAPKRLGQGIRRRKRRSEKPRKTMTTPNVAEQRPVPGPAVVLLEPDEERGARQEATIVAARVSVRHWSASSVDGAWSRASGVEPKRRFRSRHA